MSEATTPRVGFIGLGNMGEPMAERLVGEGHSMFVHDAVEAQAQSLVAGGAVWAETPAALATMCNVICTSLPGPDEFREVMLGKDGVLSAARSGTICIDFTTNSPALVRELAEEFAVRNVALLDAPVSGGVEGARQGTLAVLAGGSPEAFRRAKPIIEAVADRVLHVGDVGTATICKILHNCAVFGTNLAMMECLAVGVKAGVDAKTLVEVFQQSGLGQNLDIHRALPARLFRGKFEPRFALATAYKDMSLAAELAKSVGVPMPLASMCGKDMTEAIERGWGDRDHTIFLTLQEERSGVAVRTDP